MKTQAQKKKLKPLTEINLIVSGDTIQSDWWTPELVDMLCDICQKCSGYKSEEKPLDCLIGNQWCG